MSATSRCRAWRMSPIVRSPHAHARIVKIAADAAKKAPGVIAVVTGAELAKVMTPWVGVLTHLKGLKSAPQSPIAVERACWQGEAVVRRGRAHARRGRGCLRAGRGDLRGTAGGHRSGNRARRQDAGDPCLARRQSLLRTQAGRRRGRQGLRRRPTPWWRPPSCSAATPASPTSRARSSPTGTRASSA